MVVQTHSLTASPTFSPSWWTPALAISYLLKESGQEGSGGASCSRGCSQNWAGMSLTFITLNTPTIQQHQSHPNLPSSSPSASQGPSDSSASTIPSWQTVQISQGVSGKMDLAMRRNLAVRKEQIYPCFPPFGTGTSSPAHFSLCFGSANPMVRSQHCKSHQLEQRTPNFPALGLGLLLKLLTAD